MYKDYQGVAVQSPDDNIFMAGVNSIHVWDLMASIKNSLASYPASVRERVDAKLIYNSSTLRKLAAAIMSAINNGGTSREPDCVSTSQELFSLVDKYTKGRRPYTILLTGSTGSLGSYILHNLVQDPDVVRVYCLNRTFDAKERQTKINTTRGLSTDWRKVRFVHGNLSKPFFALDGETYDDMADKVNHIIRE